MQQHPKKSFKKKRGADAWKARRVPASRSPEAKTPNTFVRLTQGNLSPDGCETTTAQPLDGNIFLQFADKTVSSPSRHPGDFVSRRTYRGGNRRAARQPNRSDSDSRCTISIVAPLWFMV